MRLDITDRFRRDVGHGQRSANGPSLAVGAWGSIANLSGAIVVDRCPLYHRVNVVSARDSVLQTLEDDHADSAAPDGPVGFRVERAARPAGRKDVTLGVPISGRLRNTDRHAPGQRHIALPCQQALTGKVHGHQ